LSDGKKESVSTEKANGSSSSSGSGGGSSGSSGSGDSQNQIKILKNEMEEIIKKTKRKR